MFKLRLEEYKYLNHGKCSDWLEVLTFLNEGQCSDWLEEF